MVSIIYRSYSQLLYIIHHSISRTSESVVIITEKLAAELFFLNRAIIEMEVISLQSP